MNNSRRSFPAVVALAFAPDITINDRFGLIETFINRGEESPTDNFITPCSFHDNEYASSSPMEVLAIVSLINFSSPFKNS